MLYNSYVTFIKQLCNSYECKSLYQNIIQQKYQKSLKIRHLDEISVTFVTVT